MTIKIIAYGIAKDILNENKMLLDVDHAANIASLKELLVRKFPEFNKLNKLSFAVNESYVTDDYVLHSNDEVVIIPPVSGG